MEKVGLNWVDIFVLLVYFLILFTISFIAMRKKRGSSKTSDSETYFLAGHSAVWYAIAGSIYSSNVGAEHFIGLAGSASQDGLSIGMFEWEATLILLLLGWIFTPMYLSSRCATTPEYLEKRFSTGSRIFLTIICLLLYILTKISATLYAGSVIFNLVLGWNFYVSAIVLLLITAVYSILGGLKSVIWTETFQTVLLVVGGLTTVGVGLKKVGGFSGLKENPNVPDSFFHIFASRNNEDIPWPGTICMPASSIFYWCVDQLIVQRVLAAKNLSHAKSGCVASGYLKILPMFMLVLPGMIARALYPKDVNDNPNIAFPMLLTKLMPHGVLGLILAGILSALMSSLASIFNSSSTLVTYDIYQRKIRPKASERELLIVGKLSGSVIVLLSILWIPVIPRVSDQLFISINKVAAYLAPPFTAVMFAGFFWQRTNNLAASVSLYFGCFIGMVRLIAEAATSGSSIDSSKHPFSHVFVKINYLYFAAISFLISSFLIVVISLLSKPPPKEKIIGFTWKTKNSQPLIDNSERNSVLHEKLSDDENKSNDFKQESDSNDFKQESDLNDFKQESDLNDLNNENKSNEENDLKENQNQKDSKKENQNQPLVVNSENDNLEKQSLLTSDDVIHSNIDNNQNNNQNNNSKNNYDYDSFQNTNSQHPKSKFRSFLYRNLNNILAIGLIITMITLFTVFR
ncbi:sodium:solute symporter-related [Anaeramoeba ignava]|uniref:Sodium:solute symporter-related n=1 Tax=Anaeramoeba ignava TaxID=1746090 RepID=A0A9Q0LUT0_ANAIG|nr:sodium:solute symporter-related [Anaeramoeba ignava]